MVARQEVQERLFTVKFDRLTSTAWAWNAIKKPTSIEIAIPIIIFLCVFIFVLLLVFKLFFSYHAIVTHSLVSKGHATFSFFAPFCFF